MTSEIRANTLKNRVGLGTVSFTNTGLVVSGIVTANSFSGPYNGTDIVGTGITLTSTDAGSAAGPELKLFRNSASPANADYLGQIKFAGESSTGVERNYAKITGKILDVTNGSEDGILEFAHIKAGSQTITGRWRSDSLQLLNSTNFSVAGNAEITGTTTLTGDVGIGVNDPDAKLEVLEDVYIKGSSGDGSVGIQIRSGSSALSNQHQIRTGGGTGQQIFIEALGASSAIVSKVAGSERLRIDHQGKITHTNFNGVGFTMSGTGDPTLQISDADGTNQYVQLAHNGGDSYIVTRNNTSHGEFLVYSQNGTDTLPRIKIGNDGTWTKYLNSSSTPQVAFGGTGQINGITAMPSMAGSPLVVGRDTGTTRSAHFAGHLQFDSGYGIQGTEFSVYGNTSGLYLNSNVSGDAIIFQSHNGSSVGERCRIDSGGLRVNKTTTSDYGRFEVKGPTADNIETSDIRTKTVATFSGGSPGTTAAGKGAGIVIKPIADRGCNYFIGVANDSTNQEAHGRFIIRSGNFASATAERLRIDSSGHITPGTDNSQHIGNGTTNFNSIWASTRFRGNDNVKLVLGNSQDFVIYHDGSGTNFINSPQGGSLQIKSGTGDNANLKHIQCDYNGNTVIYHQNGGSAAERIKTTNDGIEFGGEVNFTSGYNVRTFAGTVYLSDGQHADIVQNNSGYGWGFFEFYCVSYHGSIGRARWIGSMSRYSNNDNYPTINNSMGYTDLQRVATGSPTGQVNMVRIQRTGTYGTVQYNYYVRCYAPNSSVNWSNAGYATKKYDGN